MTLAMSLWVGGQGQVSARTEKRGLPVVEKVAGGRTLVASGARRRKLGRRGLASEDVTGCRGEARLGLFDVGGLRGRARSGTASPRRSVRADDGQRVVASEPGRATAGSAAGLCSVAAHFPGFACEVKQRRVSSSERKRRTRDDGGTR